MKIVVVSGSAAWERHLLRVLHARHDVALHRTLDAAGDDADTPGALTLVHAGYIRQKPGILAAHGFADAARRRIGVAADAPTLDELFAMTRHGALAYFNSFMADVHYAQLISLLGQGQRWYPPALLAQALELASQRLETTASAELLSPLTPREREIALDVARGMSNSEVASLRRIAESSVKTHLTRIFKKLQVRSRTELAVACNRSEDMALGEA